jgi:hypothetical protein
LNCEETQIVELAQGVRSILAAAVLIAATATLGCGGGVYVGYRAYDPYRSDYHVWDANEGVFYSRWSVETHHDPHGDFRKLNKHDQGEYWKWRHNQR